MAKPSVRSLPASLAHLPGPTIAVEPYEEKLARRGEWAMSEGSRFFQGKSEVQRTLQKITRKLEELGIDYVVVGGMAMFQHGYRRFTDDVDLLVTREGLKEIHDKLSGLGYLPPFPGSKNLRDTEHGVKIEFLVTGAFPGDGKDKPVAFPSPNAVAEEIDGIRYVTLPTLIELKLASGMTSSERMRDLADVIELIKALDLASSFAEKLHPFVQEKYKQLWGDAHPPAKRYVTLWRNKWLTAEAQSLEDMIQSLQAAVDTLRAMLADGVTLDPEGGTSHDYAYLVTTDPAVARKYDMHDEKEFWEDADSEDREQDGEDAAGAS
jgi:Nucleotidyl transferase of unknown function (DUF2204)